MRISPHSRVASPPVGDEAAITRAVSSTPTRRAGRVLCSRAPHRPWCSLIGYPELGATDADYSDFYQAAAAAP